MRVTPNQYGRLLGFGYSKELIRLLDRKSATLLITATEKNGGKKLPC